MTNSFTKFKPGCLRKLELLNVSCSADTKISAKKHKGMSSPWTFFHALQL